MPCYTLNRPLRGPGEWTRRTVDGRSKKPGMFVNLADDFPTLPTRPPVEHRNHLVAVAVANPLPWAFNRKPSEKVTVRGSSAML